jgi:signal transduction histidine kinase
MALTLLSKAKGLRIRFYLLELLKISLFAAAYLGGYACSRYFAQRTGTRLWFPDSFLLCTLLLVPRKKWWLYILVTAPARFIPAVRAPVPAWFLWVNWINDTGKAMLVASLLQYATGNLLLFKRVRQYATYLGVAVILAPLLSAFFGALVRLTLGHSFWPAFGQWYLGDALTNLVLTPTLFLWFSHEYRRLGPRLLETVVWAAGFAMCLGYVAESTWYNESLIALYAPFPFLIWAAARLGAIGASSGITLTTLFVILGLSHAKGPFYPVAHDMHFLQLFLAVLALPILFVATFFEERQTVEQRLREGREQLNRDYERVSNLARRLIGAREDERQGIERELRDDVSRQLAAQIAALQLEREKQAAHLREVEKMAAAGRLAASLAHEINNPLEAVSNVLYLLGSSPDLDPASAGLISIASKEVARVARIVRQSLSYYRVGTAAKEVDLAALIEESLQVFSDKLQHGGIVIIKKITPGTSIIGFADEIRQVVDNLLVNCLEATSPGGRLALRLRPLGSRKNHSKLGARLTIADNGSGIPKAYLAKIFEPFFTTKAEKGTGLGLWVVKGIVEKHGGNIKIRSTDAPGRSGTTVSIFWPSAVESRPTLAP